MTPPLDDWKSQLRYFPCYSTDGKVCACGKADCEKQGKHPMVSGWQRIATNDPEQVAEWRRDPKVNLAIACGRDSNLFVVDVDGIYGPITIAELEKENGPLPDTFTVRTGNGLQYYFQYPSTPLPNSVGFAEHLDTRSEGGYVIAEGGRHKTGRTYAAIKDVPPAVMPEWLINKILAGVGKGKDRKSAPGVIVPVGGFQQGSRNNDIFKLAASLHHKNLSIDAARAALLTENAVADKPLPEHEVLTALKSAYGYPTDDDREPIDYSDQGLTNEFIASNPPLKYVTDDQSWVGYLNGLWLPKKAPTFEIGELLKSLEPAGIPDPKVAKWIHHRLYSKEAVSAVTFFAISRPELGITACEFDTDPMLLGLPDGEVLDLRTGARRAATPSDLITRALAVAPEGRCDRWLAYLEEVHPNDPELISYLQRWAGYCLTASVQEDMILFLIGVGGSGKGTFVEPLQKLLGGYCVSIPIGMLLEETAEDRRLNYIASLLGTRLAVCSEGSKQRRLDSRGIKLLTGGGWTTGRRLSHQPFNFKQTHKLCVLANDNPVLELDDAMRQRVHVVPFNQKFRDTQKEEKGLREFFTEPEQLRGIFNWVLEGCMAYQREGLKPPKSVTATTTEFFEDMDLFDKFTKDNLLLNEKTLTHFQPTAPMFHRWERYCQLEGDKLSIGTQRTFVAALKAKFPHLKLDRKRIDNQQVRGVYGIQLMPAPQMAFAGARVTRPVNNVPDFSKLFV